MVDTEMRVINKYGKDVASNGLEKGEIIVKGSGVMSTDKVSNQADGWLYTGDIGTINPDGRIIIVERKKDITMTEGNNISSIDMEHTLHTHPAIQDAVIIAVPHKEIGETLHVFVVVHEGYIIEQQEIIDFFKDKLPHSKKPDEITFLAELPKTLSGKILRSQLI